MVTSRVLHCATQLHIWHDRNVNNVLSLHAMEILRCLKLVECSTTPLLHHCHVVEREDSDCSSAWISIQLCTQFQASQLSMLKCVESSSYQVILPDGESIKIVDGFI